MHTKLAEWLAEKRKRGRLSLRQTALKTGLSHATIADIIKGTHPTPKTLRKLARGLNADLDYLLIIAGYRNKPKNLDTPSWLRTIALLSPDHQHTLEVLVGEFATIDGIVPPSTGGEK